MAKKLTVSQKSMNHSKYTSFWLDEDDYSVSRYTGGYFTDFDDDKKGGKDCKVYTTKAEKTLELIKLGAFMRSCGNFVRILTSRQDITVKYADGDTSYTDGKTVTLSSDAEGNFDSTVGLALHEASHICKTDFDLLKVLFENVPTRRKYITREMINKVCKLNPKIVNWDFAKVFGTMSYATDNSLSPIQIRADFFLLLQFKDISNWIEDRRIDSWVYATAPGYRGYYEALYNRYFYSDDVSKQLKANTTFNTETLDSYMYHIINSLNPAQNPDTLKGLREIKSLINVTKIDRLQNSEMVNDVSRQVLEVIMKNITELDFKTQQMNKFGKGGDCHDGNGVDDGMSIDIDSLTDAKCKEMFGMGKAALKRLLKKMTEQKDFVAGDIKKKAISKTDASNLSTLQSSGVSVELAGGEEFNGKTIQVTVIKKLTDEIMENESFRNAFDPNPARHYGNDQLESAVSQGFILGKQLGSRLQVRNEEKTLKFTRQDAGKMDRRLVASLGYDMENVFSKIEVNRFNKATIHVSVDASGSMRVKRFHNAIKTCVAIAVAAKMTNNIECVITFRTTTSSNPLVYVAYDSKVNATAHIRKYFPKLLANGSTPESLCFEALMHDVFPSNLSNDEQFYFVNLSDGEPGYSKSQNNGENFSYDGESAYRHCKRMIDKMTRTGATIISYLISDCDGQDSLRSLRKMYGINNAFNINTNSVEQIARVMNKKFLSASKANRNDGGSI